MCGIAGVVGKSLDKTTICAMLDTMRRRGPDGSGVYESPLCTLLHTRLAVIDPAGGAQPMSCAWGQDCYTITYNGEIYNLSDVKRELQSAGHQFLTRSDTEVVLHAFIEWNEKCPDHLNGIFAFAVWSERERRLYLCRDRFGVKPLFYSQINEDLVFASEIKTILAYPGAKRTVGKEGISQLILLGPGKIPGRTLYDGIYELLPGNFAWYEEGRFRTRPYWRLLDRPYMDSFDETVEKVRYLVVDSVKRQMVSDVPLGTFLSGGLDSSVITALCASYQKNILDTFSVDYYNNNLYFKADKFQPTQDAEYIDIMKEFASSNHHTTTLRPEGLLEVLEESTIARDAPGMADVDFSLFAFCKEVRNHVKVALSGECADELFGGYPWFRDADVRNTAGFPWSQNLTYRKAFLNDAWRVDEGFVHDLYSSTVAGCDVCSGTDDIDRRTKEMMVLNIYWFMQTLLERKDRMSMYHGLEVRVPFCDHRLAEYLYTVPWKLKDHAGREKGLLRTAMQGVLPDAVLWRKKSPYPKTHDPKYCEAVENMMKRVLERNDAPLFQIVKRDKVKELLDNEQPWPWYGQLMTRPQTIAYFLQIDFWLQHYHISLV